MAVLAQISKGLGSVATSGACSSCSKPKSHSGCYWGQCPDKALWDFLKRGLTNKTSRDHSVSSIFVSSGCCFFPCPVFEHRKVFIGAEVKEIMAKWVKTDQTSAFSEMSLQPLHFRKWVYNHCTTVLSFLKAGVHRAYQPGGFETLQLPKLQAASQPLAVPLCPISAARPRGSWTGPLGIWKDLLTIFRPKWMMHTSLVKVVKWTGWNSVFLRKSSGQVVQNLDASVPEICCFFFFFPGVSRAVQKLFFFPIWILFLWFIDRGHALQSAGAKCHWA